MFIYGIKVTIYAYVSFLISFFMASGIAKSIFVRKMLLFWAITAFFLFVLQLPALTFVVAAVTLIVFRKGLTKSEIVCFLIVAVAAIPGWTKYVVTFGSPLYAFYIWNIAVIILLLPLVNAVDFKKKPINLCDLSIVILFFYTAIMQAAGGTPVVALLNHILNSLLYYLIPYFLLSRTVVTDSKELLYYACLGFFILGMILSSIFLVNQLVQLDFYNVLSRTASLYGYGGGAQYRGGFLRTEGPLSGETMGVLISASFISLLIIKRFFLVSKVKFFGILVLFVFAVVSSGSRGSLLTLIIAVSFYIFLNSAYLLRFFIVILALTTVSAYTSFVPNEPVYQDEYGTFDYRKELFKASFEFIKTKPLFGDINYLNSGYFEHMRRGAGKFIDVVSVYLQYMLPYGYIGLFLYLVPFLMTLIQLVSLSMFSRKQKGEYGEFLMLYACLLLGFLIMIATVSDVGLIGFYGYIFLALGRRVLSCA